jgi:hypothetical protein
MQEKEIWKRLIYQGKDYGDFYEISNYGNIRNSKTHKVRRNNILKTGYYFVSGSLGSRDIKITFKNHKAVAETFIDNPNNLPMVNHKDGNKLNNYIDNLEWCTNAENLQHAARNNLLCIYRGKDNVNAKLNEEAVCFIRENYIPYDKVLGTRGLARKFDVDHKTIIRVLNNETWV